jgi:hypothetical protein
MTKYQPQPDSPKLEQLRGYLEAFYHLCAVGAWEKAANLIKIGVAVTTWTAPINNSEDIYLDGHYTVSSVILATTENK